MNVKLEWLLNSYINHIDDAKMWFFESDGSAKSKKLLCVKYDENYEQMKEDLKERTIYFISIHPDRIEVYLRPKGWKK